MDIAYITPSDPYGELEKFEDRGFARLPGLIDEAMTALYKEFYRARVILDTNIIKRIQLATKRAHRLSAKKSLREFETTCAPWSANSVDILADVIRMQFAASGVALTKEGKLPAPYEARINKAVVRAKEIGTLES